MRKGLVIPNLFCIFVSNLKTTTMEKLNKDVYEVYYNMNETEVNDRLNKWFIGDNSVIKLLYQTG